MRFRGRRSVKLFKASTVCWDAGSLVRRGFLLLRLLKLGALRAVVGPELLPKLPARFGAPPLLPCPFPNPFDDLFAHPSVITHRGPKNPLARCCVAVKRSRYPEHKSSLGPLPPFRSPAFKPFPDLSPRQE